jgi:glucose dehydrogenase
MTLEAPVCRGFERKERGRRAAADRSALFVALLLLAVWSPPLVSSVSGQDRGNPAGEWRYWGGDAWSTRYSPLDQISAGNFEGMEVAWTWRGDNFGPEVDFVFRSTPIYAKGRLYTVAGYRRTAVAIDPATGETLWTFREEPTARWERSSRQNYGKGVAYAELDGREIIYLVTPGFFLHALDASTGLPIPEFGKNGTVDMLADLGHPYDPHYGIPDSIGYITNSSPPIVVNGVVVVGSSNLTGRLETRTENVPGDILAYDARTGRHRWKFNVIPRPGEFGHETWENDAWSYSGNINAWAPLSADPERGLVYIPTDAPTNDYFGGFRPGDNLFGNSVLALDVQTGQRVWHFQTIRHDIWDWDNPVAPILMDIESGGRRIPALVQVTKQGFAYALDRTNGAAIWPMEDRPMPASRVPGERTAATQLFPTRPAAYEMQGLTEDDLLDYTPELRRMALEIIRDYQLGPLFNPHVHQGNPEGKRASVMCPSASGGANILGGAVHDPETNILYVASVKSCGAMVLIPGVDAEDPGRQTSGRTVVDWHTAGAASLPGIEGLPLFKPPYGRITAIDMNTGEHLWWIPNGDTPDRIRNHPRLQGVELPNTGTPSHATAIATGSLLIYGEGRGGRARLHAVDKRSGARVGTIELPAPSSTAPMTYLHEGKQYLVVPVGGAGHPGSLVAYRLP